MKDESDKLSEVDSIRNLTQRSQNIKGNQKTSVQQYLSKIYKNILQL